MKTTLTLLLAVACHALVVTQAFSTEEGQPAPEFKVKTLAGDMVSRATLAGHPAMLIFWNTWCPSCKKELPEVEKLATKYSSSGLSFLAINTGLNDSEGKARAYWQKNRFHFPTGFDTYFDTAESFGVRGVPTIVLVDAKGIVRYKGSQLPDRMDDRMRQLSYK